MNYTQIENANALNFALKLRVKTIMTENIDYQDKIILKIKQLREEKGISQSKLSEILGISRGQMSNIENPHYTHKYTLKQLDAACKALDYPIEKLFLPNTKIAPECSKVIGEMIERIIRYE